MAELADLDTLFAKLAAVEDQRPTLGSAVDPVVDQIQSLILEQVPAPTPKEVEIAASWAVVTKSTESLGISVEPDPEVAQALHATSRYELLLARLGRSGIAPEAIEEPVPVVEPDVPSPKPEPDAIAAAQAVPVPAPIEPALPTAPVTPAGQPKNTAPIGAPEKADNSAERLAEAVFDITDPDVITLNGERLVGNHKGTVNEYKQVLADMVQALEAAGGEPLSISAFLKGQTGVSSTMLKLILSGKKPADPNVDYTAVRKYHDKLYTLVEKLRDAAVIDHQRGQAGGQEGATASKSGTLQLLAPIKLVGTPPNKLPYRVTVNLYEQSINNGRKAKSEGGDQSANGDTTKIVFDKDPSRFGRVARALGAIATHSEPDDKVTRSKVLEWMARDEQDQTDETRPSQDESGHSLSEKRVTDDLQDVVDAFGGAFPLSRHSRSGGAHYRWLPGSMVEIIEGRPEKPRFEDPVFITVDSTGVKATIDGAEHKIINYLHTSINLEGVTSDLEVLTERNRKLFEVLSIMEREDDYSARDIASFLSGTGETEEQVNVLLHRLRTIVRRLNEYSDSEPIINWRDHNGVMIDLNRRIVLVGGTETEAGPAATGEPAAAVAGTAPTGDEQADEGAVPAANNGDELIDLTDHVGDRRTAQDIVNSVKTHLLDRDKQIILGRLVQHGRFEYPESLEQAAYLLLLLSDPTVMAQTRHGSNRPFSTDITAFNTFVAEATYACYLRTLSWGNFTELLTLVAGENDARPEANTMFALAQGFDDQTSRLREASHILADQDEVSRNSAFLENVVEHLIAGRVPKPSNAIQAVGLLDAFRTNRSIIAKGKEGSPRTTAEFTAMIAQMHGYVGKLMGVSNLQTITESRGPNPTAARTRRAEQTTGGRETGVPAQREELGRQTGGGGHRGRRRGRGSRGGRDGGSRGR